jgi:diguanylate cyclase (GGDEF)-like protein/PAS domain S-box-containing protein
MDTLTILIADDDTITTAILERMLQPFSRDILVAQNGKIGLELFERHRPDIVLSDINMPEMGGLEMVEQIRRRDSDVKIAIFTNFEKRDILHKAINFGVNQFFSKPFEVKHFSKVIQHLCDDVMAKRRIQAELDRQQNVLLAINTMAQSFLQHQDWYEALNQELFLLKKAAQSTSIFLYQNDGTPEYSGAYKLLALNDNPKARARKRIDYKKHNLMQWKNALAKGEPIIGSKNEFGYSKRNLMHAFKIDSLIILPVFVGEAWWGFLGIGNTSERPLKYGDMEMLSTVASIIGSAINNQRNLQALQMSSAVFKHTVDGVLITDAENKILHVNDAFTDITGYAPEAVIGKDPKLLKSGQHDVHFYKKMWEQIQSEGYWQGEITNRTATGEIYIEWLSINAVRDSMGRIENHIGIFSDVTHQRKDAAEHAYLATHDPLTGLSNRLLLNDRLQHAIAHANRFDKCVAVLFCDLDNFKPINDTYGHSCGDEVLKGIAKRMKSILRKEDTICRFGGDEFVILIEDLSSFDFLDTIVKKISALSETPICAERQDLPIEMSIGVALYPDDAENGPTLLKAADNAMYRAKHNGKNAIAYAQEDTRTYCTSGISI